MEATLLAPCRGVVRKAGGQGALSRLFIVHAAQALGGGRAAVAVAAGAPLHIRSTMAS